MTEAEWLSDDDPSPLLSYLEDRGQADARRARLFAAACCRRVGHLVLDPASRAALDTAERFADGLATEEQRAAAHAAARDAAANVSPPASEAAAGAARASVAVASAYGEAADAVAATLANPVPADEIARRTAGAFAAFDYLDQTDAEAAEAYKTERAHQADVLRDLFGNPFRPQSQDPAWRTPALATRAQQIYDEESFDRLPALAEGVKGAGCTDAELLAHLRSEGPHAKGCWALDVVRGKS